MDEFIKLLDPAYELIQYSIKENKVIFHIASTITELECPFCGSKTYSALPYIFSRLSRIIFRFNRILKF